MTGIGRAATTLIVSACLAAVGVGVGTTVAATPAGAAAQEQAIVDFAASQQGVPYCEGGGGTHGPTVGSASSTCAPGVKGYDCMSLPVYAVYQATGIVLPSNGTQPRGVGTFIPPGNFPYTADLLPGDIVYWGGTINRYHHSAVYAGNGMVWDDFQPGAHVQLHTMAFLEQSYTYDGAIRYWTGGQSVTPPPVNGHGYDLVGSDGGVFVFGGGFYGSLPGLGISVDDITGHRAHRPATTATSWSGRTAGCSPSTPPLPTRCPASGSGSTTSWASCPPSTTGATSWWAGTAGCSASTPPSRTRCPGWASTSTTSPASPPPRTTTGTGWWDRTARSTPSGTPTTSATARPGRWPSPPPTTGAATGWWGPTAPSPPTATPRSFGDLPSLGVAVDNIVGIVVSPDSRGYNLIGSDGGVFSFGDAFNEGSLPGLGVNVDNVVGAVPT